MVTKMFPLQFLKKSPFFGSYGKMNYRLMKADDQLQVCIYPGPFCFDATSEERKQYFTYEFSDTGYDAAIAQMNEVYEATNWDVL